jgi:DNA replication protein DnaC
MVSKAQVMALTAGDSWLEKGANLLLFGPPGAGKSHLAAAIGLALVEHGWRVLFMRTSDLVQRLQIARRESPNKNSSGKISGFAAAAVMPFFGQQPAGCVPRSP